MLRLKHQKSMYFDQYQLKRSKLHLNVQMPPTNSGVRSSGFEIPRISLLTALALGCTQGDNRSNTLVPNSRIGTLSMDVSCCIAYVFTLVFIERLVRLHVETSRASNDLEAAIQRQIRTGDFWSKVLNFTGSFYKIVRRGVIPSAAFAIISVLLALCGPISVRDVERILVLVFGFVERVFMAQCGMPN